MAWISHPSIWPFVDFYLSLGIWWKYVVLPIFSLLFVFLFGFSIWMLWRNSKKHRLELQPKSKKASTAMIKPPDFEIPVCYRTVKAQTPPFFELTSASEPSSETGKSDGRSNGRKIGIARGRPRSEAGVSVSNFHQLLAIVSFKITLSRCATRNFRGQGSRPQKRALVNEGEPKNGGSGATSPEIFLDHAF